nr:MAG TPA: hypothetical protein [Bacteriophage sp.]
MNEQVIVCAGGDFRNFSLTNDNPDCFSRRGF